MVGCRPIADIRAIPFPLYFHSSACWIDAMKTVLTALAATLVLSCSAEPQAPRESVNTSSQNDNASPEQTHCGGDLAPGAVAAYREKLARHIASGATVAPTELFDTAFIYTGLDGSRTSHPSASERVTPADWHVISHHLAISLHNGGWRGCFLGDGWAVFQSAANGSLGLSAFDQGRALSAE